MYIHIAIILICIILLIATYSMFMKENLSYYKRTLAIVYVTGTTFYTISVNVDSGMYNIYENDRHIDTGRQLSQDERMLANHVFVYLSNNAVFEVESELPYYVLEISQDNDKYAYNVGQMQGLPKEIRYNVDVLCSIMKPIIH